MRETIAKIATHRDNGQATTGTGSVASCRSGEPVASWFQPAMVDSTQNERRRATGRRPETTLEPFPSPTTNAALRLNPNDVYTLDNRGFAHLKLGQVDGAIADYDAALKLDARLPASLYGRGIASSGKATQKARPTWRRQRQFKRISPTDSQSTGWNDRCPRRAGNASNDSSKSDRMVKASARSALVRRGDSDCAAIAEAAPGGLSRLLTQPLSPARDDALPSRGPQARRSSSPCLSTQRRVREAAAPASRPKGRTAALQITCRRSPPRASSRRRRRGSSRGSSSP
jgi:hypothetical protein